jgi:hypothetical protein
MPRGLRLDGLGVLRHVMARGIERRLIFRDDCELADLVQRWGRLAQAEHGSFAGNSTTWHFVTIVLNLHIRR